MPATTGLSPFVCFFPPPSLPPSLSNSLPSSLPSFLKAESIYLSMCLGGWPLNSIVQLGAWAVDGCKNESWSPCLVQWNPVTRGGMPLSQQLPTATERQKENAALEMLKLPESDQLAIPFRFAVGWVASGCNGDPP